MNADPERFFVEDGSALGHGCCFRATVFDRQNPMTRVQDKSDMIIAECLDRETAERIAAALNAA